MFLIIWKYIVSPQHLNSFIDYYNAEGEWVKFFQHSPSWIETEFLKGEQENQFITLDKWVSEQEYRKYLADHKATYDEIDNRCAGFTLEETLVGTYFMIEI